MSLHEPISIHEALAEHATTEQPVKRVRRRLGVSWATIILFAVVISYVNGFWVTSLQITVGSLERSAPPFGRWLRDSTMMLPLYIGRGAGRGAARPSLVRAQQADPGPRRRRRRC